MTPELLDKLTDIGGIGALIIFIWVLAPLLKALARKLDAKINGDIPYDVQKGVMNIERNHLTDLQRSADRIEHKLDKLDEIEKILVEIREKLNK